MNLYMEIFVSICNLLIPLVLIMLGIICQKHYPKNISNFSGYRTERSMKNKEAWVYSQKLFGKISLIEGFITLFLSVILMIMLVLIGHAQITDTTPLLLLIQFSSFIPMYIIIETMLKRKFPDN